MADKKSNFIKIGALARKTGKTARALHLYEEKGLLKPAARSPGGFRLYGPDEIARVYWISKLQDMGFSLPQIQGLLASVEASATAPEAMQGVRELFRAKLDQTREQVMRLLQLERDLAEALGYLEGCRVCNEPSAAEVCTACASERRAEPAPTLVAGIHLGGGRRAPSSFRLLDQSDLVTLRREAPTATPTTSAAPSNDSSGSSTDFPQG